MSTLFCTGACNQIVADAMLFISLFMSLLSMFMIAQIVNESEYQRRQIAQQNSGQSHFYFMAAGNGEVIDATNKVR